MRMQVVAIVAVAALGLFVISAVSPNATIIAGVSSHGIDTSALTRTAKDMPVEQFAAI